MRDLREALTGIYLPSSTATTGQTPLSAIVTLSERDGPLQIEHLGQFPSISISFNLTPGASLGSAVDAIRQAEADVGLPASFNTSYQGALSAFQKSLSNELMLIAAAVVASLKLKLLALGSDPHRSDSPEAYNLFLRAREFRRRGDLEDIERAVAAYRQAIELDPNYAAAYAGLSFSETAIANSTQDAARFFPPAVPEECDSDPACARC